MGEQVDARSMKGADVAQSRLERTPALKRRGTECVRVHYSGKSSLRYTLDLPVVRDLKGHLTSTND